ncbi:MAG: COX15/CtaA family protein [Alphaproteobacteria bacterium]|nr:COX15/CtaA family protein [Alphaproteobacteria bacterium]
MVRPARAARAIGVGDSARDRRAIAAWLLACAAMVLVMVALGGITRLTESGLSITDWRPIVGVLPPLNDAQWQAAFDAYKQIPQYDAIHAGMTLAGFKTIYFWEWFHRLWGRLIGVVFLLPFLYFLLRRRIPASLAPKLMLLFLFGAFQGAVGWWMVESGLEHRIEVSQYRLAAHLGMAIVIYGAILWVALDLLRPDRREAAPGMRRGAGAVLVLAAVTLIAGAFVAGLRAGLIDNTFPLMDGHLVPPAWGNLAPWWRNAFENAEAAQFDHRVLAVVTWLAALALFVASFKARLSRFARGAVHALFTLVTIQAGLGIATLLLVVPLPWALAHQLGATLVITAALVARHALGSAA